MKFSAPECVHFSQDRIAEKKGKVKWDKKLKNEGQLPIYKVIQRPPAIFLSTKYQNSAEGGSIEYLPSLF